MASYQKTIILGHLGKDPELREANGKAVCNFSVAVSEKRGGQDHTEWFNITTWEKTAENCAQYLKKGSMVLLEGSVRLETYKKKDGSDGASLRITAYQVKFLSSPKNNDGEESPF